MDDKEPGSRSTYTDADLETGEAVRPTSAADELRRARAAGRDETPDVEQEPADAPEPPD
ncbi:hypothetical protein OS122_27595 [Mycolicibacterium mucogenicum]|jgi:hypothetical protein|uniref:hypothetical protein n=1 Tax=Mycolicibacterium TaxID=1866885 RepID=UPI00226A98E4|nr:MULTISPECIES: hypothetical protein [Mycolicibacterium]MCX8564653.1 hypothetical protein [Mycolicibacterium mucogenicum]